MSFDQQLVSNIILGQHVAAKTILLKRKSLLKVVDSDGQTLLHLSAKCGNAEMSRFLIQCGCQVNAQDKFGITPLMLAVTEAKDDATVKVLLTAKADIHLKDCRKSSSFRKVIKMSQTWFEILVPGLYNQEKYYRILKMFFRKVEKEVENDRELMADILQEAHCPLALVMFMSNVSVTKYLLNSGYLLNEHLRNWSTLHIAVLLHDLANVAYLVEYGANFNDQDNMNQTPLFLYNRYEDGIREQLEILKLLLNNGASLLIPRTDGLTLMEYFFTGGKKNTLLAVVKSSSDELTKCTIDGKTALHFWVQNRNRDIDQAIKLLIRKNIDINAADNEGVTALIQAVKTGFPNKVKTLLGFGATVNFIDIFDKTNLFDALISPNGYHSKYKKIVDILIHGETSTPTNEFRINFPFDFHRDQTFVLAKMLLKYLVLDEAKGENASVQVLNKIGSKIDLIKYYQTCKLQLQNVKTTVIYENVTLYKLLVESEERIILYARNEDFIRSFEEFIKKKTRHNFFYFDHLRKRVDNACVLAMLRTEASRVICEITQLYPDPDNIIFYKIVKYMSKRDLYNVTEVYNN